MLKSKYRYDYMFLSLVTFDNEVLKEIIYEALNIKVGYAKIINSKMAKRRLIERANYLDLVVETDIGYINIEVSNDSYNKYTAHRNFVYLTSLINNVTKSGMKLKDMPKVYQINLIFGKSSNVDISKYNMYSKEERKELTKKLQILNVYMDKLKETYYNNNKRLTSKMLLVGLAMTKEELEENKEENIMFEKLLKKLDEMEDKGLAPELMPVEEENKWYREMLIESAREEGLEQGIEQGIECGIVQGIEQGIQQGIEQGIEQGMQKKEREFISNMLNKKFDFKTISEITGLSLNKIKNISKNLGY